MEPSDNFAKIFCYFHNKYYNLMLSACKDAISKYPTRSEFKLYHSLGLMLTNRLEESLHDLEAITQENDIKLASTIALMYGHKFLGVAGRELFVKLDSQMKEHRKTAEPQDFYNSAIVLLTLKKTEKALDYIDKGLSTRSGHDEFLTLKGWILLTLTVSGKHNTSNIKSLFKQALENNPKDLLAIFGYSECCLHLSDFNGALNVINEAVVKFPTLKLSLWQKVKAHFAGQDWDQTSETISRFNVNEGDILFGLKYEVLISLCHSKNIKEAGNSVRKFAELVRKFEPNNTAVALEAASLFSKLCNRSDDIIKETISMLEGFLGHNVDSADLVVELANEHWLLGKTKEAIKLFKSATKIDEACFGAFLGLSLCEYSEHGKSEQLYKQIQYLLDLKDAEESAMLHLLRARTAESSNVALEHLKIISDAKSQARKRIYYSDKYLLNLDPDFTIEVIKEYLQHTTTDKRPLEYALELANLVSDACPSLAEARYLKAKLQHLKGDSCAALATLEGMDSLSSEASLLMAQIQVSDGQFERASQNLEACMSSNFKVRENPIYHYITARVDKHANNYGDAVKALTTALTLLNITARNNEVSLADKASIYVELIDTLNIVGQTDEAMKILDEATQDLQGTPEESRILLLSADNLLARKSVQGAIDLLNKIGRNENCYKEARIKTADVFLKYRKDQNAFLGVFQQFVAEQPSSESYLLLGDAYLRILEPDEALVNFDKALKDNPTDPFLIAKMGRALVETHYFNRAVEYYKTAIKSMKSQELVLQLADLYLNLREYEKGELLLLNELEDTDRSNVEDISHLLYRAKIFHILFRFQEKSGNLVYAVKSLKDAMDCLVRVRKRTIIEQNGSTDDIDKKLVDLSMKLGDTAVQMKNNEQAANYYKEGLTVSPDNVDILVALAKLYMQTNYLELCQQTCASILRIDPENEVASVMMADIAFRKVDFDMALFHFTQLVTKQPTNWEALLRLIEISRRLGTIQTCESYLKVAEERCVNSLKEPGYMYCQAYYQWHSGNLNAALKNFNQIRQDATYGTDCLYNMIDICLNPDGEMLAEQLMECDDIEYRDSRSLALKTAERLIKELKQRLESNGDDIQKCRLLSNFRLLSTKEKANIERALEDFVSIASQSPSKENLGAILGMSTAYMMLKQQQRAKNQLKRVVKHTWTFEDSDYLERCWLLLADNYIQANKLETANELIAKVLQHNKACVKALEYSGYICEKEHKFKEAANYYQQAWKVGLASNAAIGYKLAYCLMKCKKYPDAIDAANEVLKLNPDYVNVKKDILDKCINNLRI